MPRSELPPTTNRSLLLFFNNLTLLKSKVRLAPVSNAIKNNLIENLAIAQEQAERAAQIQTLHQPEQKLAA